MERFTSSRTYENPILHALVMEVVEEIPGAVLDELEESHAVIALPTIHRFYSGMATVRTTWEKCGTETEFILEIDTGNISITPRGKLLLVLGVSGAIPWTIWPFFPSLMPLIPLGVLSLFLAWIAVGRRPHAFSEELIANRLKSRLTK